MTPQEKAKELVEKYDEILFSELKFGYDKILIKQCALIAVDEIFKTGLLYGTTLGINKKFWNEVKKEIEKL